MMILTSSAELKLWAGAPVVVVFGSYCAGIGSTEYIQAEMLGQGLAEKGYVVCSGGYDGIMEAVLKGASAKGGKCIGVLTKHFDFMALRPNAWVQACVVARGLIDRIELFWEVGDAFIAFPGSTGTLAEFAVSLEMVNKSVVDSKLLLCLGDYWKPILTVIGGQPRPFNPAERVGQMVHFLTTPENIVAFLAERIP